MGIIRKKVSNFSFTPRESVAEMHAYYTDVNIY